jgi:putative ABC transport system ATP-binding protein
MILRLEALWKVYGSLIALAGITAEFAAGTFTAVMGPSGSGKSTLLHCAAGLDRPTSGEVFLDGSPLHAMSETDLTRLRRDRLGVVFQAFNLVPALTAAQNVGLPLRLAGKRPVGEEGALARVGLGGRAGHYPSELSGGEQQRVAIARALITRPAVLFADEPTGALDTRTSRDVLGLLRDLNETVGMTIVMVTHDPVAASYADRAVFLADGQIVAEIQQPTADSVFDRMRTLGA